MRPEVSVAQEWRDDTDRWIMGKCWLPLTIGTLVLASFGSGGLLAIAITTLVPLVFLLYIAIPCLCYDEIKSKHAHNMHIRGGCRESM